MRATNFLLFFFLTFCYAKISLAQQVPILERKISIRAVNRPVDEFLQETGAIAGCTFSYAVTVTRGMQPVTVDHRERPLRELLDRVFAGKVNYKERGTHVILLRVQPVDQEPEPTHFSVAGYVTDASTGERIASVTVYDKYSRASAITNEYGYYSLDIKNKERLREIILYINKEQYDDTVIYIRQTGRSVVNLTLYPLPTAPVGIDSTAIHDSLFAVNQLALVKLILSEEEQANTRNVHDTLYRKFQVSFIPYIGSNLKLSGNTVNDYSFNILGGYAMGTRKLEVAGLFNIDRDSVRNVQLAGLFNFTGGPVSGVQGAGLVNLNLKPLRGAQLAGLVNLNYDSITGAQAAGLINVNFKPSRSVMLAGLTNLSLKSTVGPQFAGLNNVALEEVRGAQVSGLLNTALKRVGGAQVAGLLNVGMQEVNGVQVAGLMNVNVTDVRGAQVSGLLNIGRRVHGTQVGFINVSDTCEGIPVGFLSFVRTGYHEFEISADETFPLNAALRTGMRQFYNILSAGMKLDSTEHHTWVFGYGLGSALDLGRRWQLNLDLTMHQPIQENHLHQFNPLTKFNLTAEKRLSRKFSLAAGPSLNVFYAHLDDPDYAQVISKLPPASTLERRTIGNYERSIWLGGKIALRFF
jgi:hypothetical protein